MDLIYQVLKQAGEISNSKSRGEITREIPRNDIGRPDIGRIEDRTPVGILVNDRNSGTIVNQGSNPGSSGSSGQSLNRPRGPSQRNSSTNLTVNPVPNSTVSGVFL